MIRTAQVADAPAIARIHVETWHAAYRGIVPESYLARMSIDKRTASWERSLRMGQVQVLIDSAADGAPAGWICYGPTRDADLPGSGEIQAIYVAPQHWGRGHGFALLRAAEKSLAERGLLPVTLWVLSANQRSCDFYRRHGYVPDGAEKNGDFDGTRLAEVRFRHDLHVPAPS